MKYVLDDLNGAELGFYISGEGKIIVYINDESRDNFAQVELGVDVIRYFGIILKNLKEQIK